MRNIILSFILVLIIPALTSAMSSNPSMGQKYLFEFSQINFAWGFQMSGIYIDKDGNVYKYNHSHAPWKPANDTSLTESDLQEKYAHKNEFVTTVTKSRINKMHNLIAPASKGKLSQPEKGCVDMGSGIYTAYLFDAQTEKYKPVTLYQVGDMPKKNISDEARILYEWLFDVFGSEPKMCIP